MFVKLRSFKVIQMKSFGLEMEAKSAGPSFLITGMEVEID